MEQKEIESLVKKTSLETSAAIVERLKEIINSSLEEIVKKQLVPLNLDRTKYLEEQLTLADGLLSKINNSFTGWLAIKIARWSVARPERKKAKELMKVEKRRIKMEKDKLKILAESYNEQKRTKAG